LNTSYHKKTGLACEVIIGDIVNDISCCGKITLFEKFKVDKILIHEENQVVDFRIAYNRDYHELETKHSINMNNAFMCHIPI
jgi:hypothetical protein